VRPLPDLPHLRIVPVDSLQSHEAVDEDRVQPLIRTLNDEGLLRNPPIVLPITGRTARYVVLDGANRTTALRQMGLATALVQVVHADDSDVRVETWNHVVLGLPSARLLEIVGNTDGLTLSPTDLEQASFDLQTGDALCYIALPEGDVYKATCGPIRFQDRVVLLGEMSATYARMGKIERANVTNCEGLDKVYPTLAGLVVFPRFEVGQVVAVAADGLLFPPGLTRFVVSPRALRINYPLEKLAGDAPIEEKQAELEAWIRQAVARRAVRYYAEATFLFDE
jgi:hypothetical protein